MWLRSCTETISHIRMVKLIERDVGDKDREQRQLFVTSLHLTAIIRYMKLKFLTGGSCWQRLFSVLFLTLLFFCAPVYANLDLVFFFCFLFFLWLLKAAFSPAFIHCRQRAACQPIYCLLTCDSRINRGNTSFVFISGCI